MRGWSVVVCWCRLVREDGGGSGRWVWSVFWPEGEQRQGGALRLFFLKGGGRLAAVFSLQRGSLGFGEGAENSKGRGAAPLLSGKRGKSVEIGGKMEGGLGSGVRWDQPWLC